MVELFQVAVYRSQLSPVDPAVEFGEAVSGLDVAGVVPLLDWPEVPVLAPDAVTEATPDVELEPEPGVAEPVALVAPDAVEPVLAGAVPVVGPAGSDGVEVALEPTGSFVFKRVRSGVAAGLVPGVAMAGAGGATAAPPVSGLVSDGSGRGDHGGVETGSGRLIRR